MTDKSKNSLVDLKKYFGTPDNPVSQTEMLEFWSSLTDKEKDDFKSTDLK